MWDEDEDDLSQSSVTRNWSSSVPNSSSDSGQASQEDLQGHVIFSTNQRISFGAGNEEEDMMQLLQIDNLVIEEEEEQEQQPPLPISIQPSQEVVGSLLLTSTNLLFASTLPSASTLNCLLKISDSSDSDSDVSHIPRVQVPSMPSILMESPQSQASSSLQQILLQRNYRKRRASENPDLEIGFGSKRDSPSTSNFSTNGNRRYSHTGNADFAIRPQSHYNGIFDALRNDNSFQQLIFRYLSQPEILHNIVPVCTEWSKGGYNVLRRRKGNKAFTLLWAVASSLSPINLVQHIHPSWIQGEQSRRRNPSQNNLLLNLNESRKIGKLDKPMTEITAIISFGNSAIEADLTNADNAHCLPLVDNYVYITGLGNFYITPNFSSFGDSFVGIDGKSSIQGGSFLSSLCIPNSAHLVIQTHFMPLAVGTSLANYSKSVPKKVDNNPWLTTKALLVFQIYDDPLISEWIKILTNDLIEKGTGYFPVISGLYSLVGTNQLKDDFTFSVAVSVALMGSKEMTTKVIELDMTECSEQNFMLKFQEISLFLNGEPWERALHPTDIEMSTFALLFCNQNLAPGQEAGAIDFIHVWKILQEFHQRFPTVPLQGVSSLSEVDVKKAVLRPETNFECEKVDSGIDGDMDWLEIEMSSMFFLNNEHLPVAAAYQNKIIPKKVTLLLVKYPLDQMDFQASRSKVMKTGKH